MGIDTHLRLQQLLASIPDDMPVEQLETLLCPLLSRNKEEQERFHELFEQCLGRALSIEKALDEILPLQIPPQPAQENSFWQKRLPLVIVLCTLLIGVLLWLTPLINKVKKPIIVTYEKVMVKVGNKSPVEHCISDSLLRSPIIQLENDCPEKTQVLTVDWSKAGKFEERKYEYQNRYAAVNFDAKQKNCLLIQGKAIGFDTVCIKSSLENGESILTYLIIEVTDSVALVPESSVVSPEAIIVAQKDLLPIPPPKDPYEYPFWLPTLIKYQYWIKSCLALLFAWGLWMFLLWRQRKRQKLIAEHKPKLKVQPPYIWNIDTGELPSIAMNEGFYKVLNRLRRRTYGEQMHINVPKTIQATLKQSGKATIQYDQQTRPPEYLILIDRQTSKNHQAQLFDFFFKKIKANGVFVERFFFEGDLRLCWNEENVDGLFVRDLQHRFYSSRLLVVSTGYSLLSPKTGQLAGWANMLTHWRDRALLTPEPPVNWGMKEAVLQKLFYVSPASTAGLIQAIEQIERGETANTVAAMANWSKTLPLSLKGDLLERLFFYFAKKDKTLKFVDDSIVQWIAACAVYPELNWELTLRIGHVLSTDNNNLLTLDNLAKLVQLPWFVNGSMPEQVRKTLLDWLKDSHRESLIKVHKCLHDLLLKKPPLPIDSVAFDKHRMYVCTYEFELTDNKKRRKNLVEEIRALNNSLQEADFTVLKVLDRKESVYDYILNDGIKNLLAPKKASGKKWVDLSWALPAWLLVSSILLLAPISLPQCKKGIVELSESLKLCLDLPENDFWVKEYYALQLAENRDYSALDSLLNTLHPLVDNQPQLDTVRLYKNIAIKLYNKGVDFYDLLHTSTVDSLDRIDKVSAFLSYVDSLKIANLYLVYSKLSKPSGQENDRLPPIANSSARRDLTNLVERILRDSTCAMFQRAASFESSLPPSVWDADILGVPDISCQPLIAQDPVPKPPDSARQVLISYAIKAIDNKTKRPVSGLFILNRKTNSKTSSNSKGLFNIDIFSGDTMVTVDYSKKGYNSGTASWTLSYLEKKASIELELLRKDTDVDSVDDLVDRCPNEKGLPKFEGCPDTDLDGFKDSEDACPTLKGLAQYLGCPDRKSMPAEVLDKVDSDEDGVPDSWDRCLDSPGTWTDGCPTRSIKIDGKFYSPPTIYFDYDKYYIRKKDAQPELDNLVDILNKHKDLTINVIGFAYQYEFLDETISYAKRIADNRASSVKRYLESNGIDASRIKTQTMVGPFAKLNAPTTYRVEIQISGTTTLD